jgi:hypothetical protein
MYALKEAASQRPDYWYLLVHKYLLYWYKSTCLLADATERVVSAYLSMCAHVCLKRH